MTKKELLEKILTRIAPDRPAAHGILLLMKQGVLSDEKIDNFVEVFRNAAKESNDEILKNKLTQSVTLLEQIQHLEHEDKIQDEKDIKELEKMLEQL